MIRRLPSGWPNTSAARRNVSVREAMEPVATQVPATPPGCWQGISGSRKWNGRVKRGVEAGNGRNIGKCSHGRIKCGERLGLMEWGQVSQGSELAFDLVIDQNRAGEFASAVHDPVAHGVHGPQLLQRLPRSRAAEPSEPSTGRS